MQVVINSILLFPFGLSAFWWPLLCGWLWPPTLDLSTGPPLPTHPWSMLSQYILLDPNTMFFLHCRTCSNKLILILFPTWVEFPNFPYIIACFSKIISGLSWYSSSVFYSFRKLDGLKNRLGNGTISTSGEQELTTYLLMLSMRSKCGKS